MKSILLGLLLITGQNVFAANLTSKMLDNMWVSCERDNGHYSDREEFPHAYFLFNAYRLGSNEDEVIEAKETKITNWETHTYWHDIFFQTEDLVAMYYGRKSKVRARVNHGEGENLAPSFEDKMTCVDLKGAAFRYALVVAKEYGAYVDKRCFGFVSDDDEGLVRFNAAFGKMDENGECGDPHFGIDVQVFTDGSLYRVEIIDA